MNSRKKPTAMAIRSPTLSENQKLVDAPGKGPRFIACHLFAYCTTVADVYSFCQTLDPQKVKVVRADEFLIAAKQFMNEEK